MCLPHWKVNRSSSPRRGVFSTIPGRVDSLSGMMRFLISILILILNLTWILNDAAAQRLFRPDRQRTVFTGFGLEAETIRSGHVELALHPGPAPHKVRAVVVEADKLVLAAPGTELRVLPPRHPFLAVWAPDFRNFRDFRYKFRQSALLQQSGRFRPKPEPLRWLNVGKGRGFRYDLGAAAFVAPLLQHRHGDRLGALEGVTESAVPGNVGHAAKAAADAEQDRVEVPLAQPVVPLNDAGLSIDVRPGILGLAVLFQDAGSHLKDHGNELEQRIVLEARSGETELALRHVARVGLTQNGVTVARNHLISLESVPKSHGDQLFGR